MARFEVAQALSIRQLGEGPTEILIEAGKRLDLVLSAVTRDTPAKRRQQQILCDLSEYQLAQVHRSPLRVSYSKDRKSILTTLNRDQEKSSLLYFRSLNYRGSVVQRPDSSDRQHDSSVEACTPAPMMTTS